MMMDGWPAHKGPLRTLADLGNVPAGTTPDWLNEPTYENADGRSGYKCRTRNSLGPQTIIDLAALAIEGYNVWILPRGRYARINIFEPEGNN
jgi:hypothetical protein